MSKIIGTGADAALVAGGYADTDVVEGEELYYQLELTHSYEKERVLSWRGHDGGTVWLLEEAVKYPKARLAPIDSGIDGCFKRAVLCTDAEALAIQASASSCYDLLRTGQQGRVVPYKHLDTLRRSLWVAR